MIALRDYQTEAVNSIHGALSTHQSTLCVLGTGGGKTVIAGFVIQEFMKLGRVIFVAHREELLVQAQQKISRITGFWPEMEKAESYANLDKSFADNTGQIVVASIQTLIAGTNGWRRMNRYVPSEVSLLVFDEAHRSSAASYRMVLSYFASNPRIKLLGLTATPRRTDNMALGEIYSSVACEFDAKELIGRGWLVPPKVLYTTIHGMDLSNVKTTAGDLNVGDLAKIMELAKPLNDVAKATIDGCDGRKTIIFTVSVDQSRLLSEIINQHKPNSARYVSGKTNNIEREQIIKDFRSGKFQYLANVGILTEGIDIPDASAVVMARPTKSTLVFAQQVGRALRPLDGLVDAHATAEARKLAILGSLKQNALIIDLVGNSGRHKLCRITDILGGKYSTKVRELAERIMQDKNAPVDVETALESAQSQVTDLDRKAAERLAMDRERARKTEVEVNIFDPFGRMPTREHGRNGFIPATEPQIKLAASHNIDVSKLSKKQASGVIGKIMNGPNGRPATVKQEKLLRWQKLWKDGMSFTEASAIITELKAKGVF